MTVHSLSPAFVKIKYSSAYAPHIQSLPTRAWTPPTGGHPFGSYTNWASVSIDADDMIQALAALYAPLFPTSTTIASYEIFTQDTPTSPILPRAANSIAVPGTIATPGYTKAVQSTFSFFDSAFNTVRLILLDSDSTNDFLPKPPEAFTTAENNLIAEFTSVNNAWSSRAGFQPTTIRTLTQTLNERLRRSYRDD